MTTTLSVRIDSDTKERLEALAKRARRSKSNLAAEAIAAFVEAESGQLDEIQAGPAEIAGTRELVVPGTRYVIPYRVRGQRVEVLAVFHGRQKWPKQL